MPRLQRPAQVDKETCLEALRDALRSEWQSSRRPQAGQPGWDAVERALGAWLHVDFSALPGGERQRALRVATLWEAERRKKVAPHALVDTPRCTALAQELAALLRAHPDRASARKETALEALRCALAEEWGAPRRPQAGYAGYEAVERAMSYWLDLDFARTPDGDRKKMLRAVTVWEAQRRKRDAPHALVDAEQRQALTEDLAVLLRNARAQRPAAPPPRAPPADADHSTCGCEAQCAADCPASATTRPAPATTRSAPAAAAPAAKRARPLAVRSGEPTAGEKKAAALQLSIDAHAKLHGYGCRHTDHIAAHGAIACSHWRPGDAAPHIDFLLLDGTLDCRFDLLCESLAVDGSAPYSFENCKCDEIDVSQLFDFSVPGAFAPVALRHGGHADLAVSHGDHFDLIGSACGHDHAAGRGHLPQRTDAQMRTDARILGPDDCDNWGACGTIAPLHLDEADLELCTVLTAALAAPQEDDKPREDYYSAKPHEN
ncbi:hypothetical protein M885DRAFT_620574 [Pelagophyceae sp. CCMP2097]|nr:hypothetical protein M885DRAFT_620574 [Pelagophyceae sp. CCMP2097]